MQLLTICDVQRNDVDGRSRGPFQGIISKCDLNQEELPSSRCFVSHLQAALCTNCCVFSCKRTPTYSHVYWVTVSKKQSANVEQKDSLKLSLLPHDVTQFSLSSSLPFQMRVKQRVSEWATVPTHYKV
jgi:hypothetical protein